MKKTRASNGLVLNVVEDVDRFLELVRDLSPLADADYDNKVLAIISKNYGVNRPDKASSESFASYAAMENESCLALFITRSEGHDRQLVEVFVKDNTAITPKLFPVINALDSNLLENKINLVPDGTGNYWNFNRLPNNLTIHSNLAPAVSAFCFDCSELIKLPNNLTVHGDFMFSRLTHQQSSPYLGGLHEIPDDLTVYGKLEISKKISKIGKNLYVKDLTFCHATLNPIGKCQRLSLYAENRDEIDLSDLEVENVCDIFSLSPLEVMGKVKNLRCGSLNLDMSAVSTLENIETDKLTVKNDVKLTAIKNLRCKFLYLESTLVSYLENIKVDEVLSIISSPSLTHLPDGLVVNELYVRSPLDSLPKNAVVKHKTFLAGKSQYDIDIPESFCSLGGIHYA